ncbi:MAG: hypothetical protein C5B43_00130 [Verrucomicrobia bacterium]|nr:MAG: hypothetical protein C5B43_00130 [Verrucomicrobiota bacterium]
MAKIFKKYLKNKSILTTVTTEFRIQNILNCYTMKKWSKKIKLLILATLSIGLFNVTFSNENYVIKKDPAPLYDPSENADNILFEFMRGNQLLSFLESSEMKIADEEQLKKIQALPFRSLYSQLEVKLRALVQAEEDYGSSVATAKGWSEIVSWKKETEDMASLCN